MYSHSNGGIKTTKKVNNTSAVIFHNCIYKNGMASCYIALLQRLQTFNTLQLCEEV